ncbi:hypothetical protein Pint_07824 [Pistacia integerrima]|uniref:Uncharacterized protein n=1 Tax=Pistacia integerrima TaxID=434235 RepID=A0ACC0XSI4_9ROSI|nr:hypothetical protein Pint_07824 [Pistacia integerrima]
MENIIHVDEKWFYMTKQSEKYYLLLDKDEPLCTCKSKTFITKVMFLAAVTRPRFDESGNELFSGKIGIFPFINKEPARRSSKNRSAGTMETKTINSINKEIYRSYIIEKLLPAIRDKWPRIDAGSPIFMQQDNAKPHIGLDDEYFQSNATKDGFDILMYDFNFESQRSYEEQPAKKKPEKRKSMDQGLEAFVNTSVDWKETPKAHEFKADLLGLKKEEVKVEIEDDRVLQISGEGNI